MISLTKKELQEIKESLESHNDSRTMLPIWFLKVTAAIVKAIDWIDANLETRGEEEFIKVPSIFSFKKWKAICDLLFSVIKSVKQ